MNNWTIVVAPEVVRALYQIPRGRVSEVTTAIDDLRRVPMPFGAQSIEGRDETYRIAVAGHIIEYELDREGQRIVLLFIS